MVIHHACFAVSHMSHRAHLETLCSSQAMVRSFSIDASHTHSSLFSLKVLACVEVSVSLPSRHLSGSAPTFTLQHFKERPKGGWANMDMCRRPCNQGGRWEGGRNQWLFFLFCFEGLFKAHCRILLKLKDLIWILFLLWLQIIFY